MRLLHTSDWHLGRSFGPVPLLDDQRAMGEWLVATAVDERVDLVVVAGDVYDRAIPPTAAIELLRDTLQRLQAARIRTVVISGNHDSSERVAAYGGLTDQSGIHVRGGYHRAGEVLRLEFDDGPLDVVALPYLDPVLAPLDRVGPPAPGDEPDTAARRWRATHQAVLAQAGGAAKAVLRAPRSLAVAHALVVSGAGAPGLVRSDSERELTVGGTGAVDVSVFDGFSYSALGHLHAPQLVGGRANVRYCGSPLAYSFSEQAPKQVLLVELAPDGSTEVQPLAVPCGRRVCQVTGTIDELLAEVRADAVDRFVKAVLTDAGPVVDAKVRLQQRYPWVVEIELRPERPAGTTASAGHAGERRSLSPAAAADAYWHDLFGTAPDHDEAELLVRMLDEAVRG